MRRGFTLAVTIGTVIGVGIMRTPGEIAVSIPDPWIYMAFWTIAGVFCLLSLSVLGELIALTPKSGGGYVLVDRAFGQFPGFVVGWSEWIAICAVRALHAVVMMEFLGLLLPNAMLFRLEGALGITTIFALVQIYGPRLTALLQEISAIVGAVVLLGVGGSLVFGALGTGSPRDIAPVVSELSHDLFGGYALALSAIVLTYNGWVAPAFFNGEMREGPSETIAGAFKGLLIVIALYLVVNGAVVMSVPLSSLQGHQLALAGALESLYGPVASSLLVGLAILILLGQQNTGYMLASRVIYALSVDGFANRGSTRVTNRGAPIGGVVLSWGLICGLIIVGGFEFLLTFFSLIAVLITVALMAGVIRLRIVEPNTIRIYESWSYPWVAIGVTLAWSAIAVFVAIQSPETALSAALMVVGSVPAFLWLNSRSKQSPMAG